MRKKKNCLQRKKFNIEKYNWSFKIKQTNMPRRVQDSRGLQINVNEKTER